MASFLFLLYKFTHSHKNTISHLGSFQISLKCQIGKNWNLDSAFTPYCFMIFKTVAFRLLPRTLSKQLFLCLLYILVLIYFQLGVFCASIRNSKETMLYFLHVCLVCNGTHPNNSRSLFVSFSLGLHLG